MSNNPCIGCKSLVENPRYRCKDGNKLQVFEIAHGGKMPFPNKDNCFK